MGEGADERIETLVSQLEAAHDKLAEVERRVAALEEDNDALREELSDVRAEMHERTDLLEIANTVDGLGWRQKGLLLVQNAAEEARGRPDSEPARGSLTAKEGLVALQRSVRRETVYDLYEYLDEELFADSDVVTYEKEPRGHDPPSRLVVDLDGGELPSDVEEVPT
ncbi:MAG: hypothetical protein ABEH77_00250 [Halobacteriaceae archaeon]